MKCELKQHERRGGLSIRTAVKQVLIAQQDKKYEKELAQRRMTYEQWAGEQDRILAESHAADPETRGEQVLRNL